MYEAIKNTGLYWQPLGGNNIDQISGHCYRYTDVIRSNGKRQSTTKLVELGKIDQHQRQQFPIFGIFCPIKKICLKPFF